MPRTYAEIMGLQVEAERLVRMGESRAEVSRRLGVHPQTLAGWALRYGGRKKDLDVERATAATWATIRAVRAANAQADERKALKGRLEAVLKAAPALLADGSDAALGRLQALVEGIGPTPALEAPKVELPPDPMGGSVSLGDMPTPGDEGYEAPDETEPDWDEVLGEGWDRPRP